MAEMTESEKSKSHKIIHVAAAKAAAAGAGLAQVPGADSMVIIPAQISMIMALAKVFDVSLTESAAKSLLATAGETVAGRGISQFLVGWIPGIGNAINASTAAGITEAIGWVIANNFAGRCR